MDVRIFESINGLAAHDRWLDPLMSGASRFGPYVLVFIFLLLWLWPGLRPARDRRQKAAVLGVASALIALGINQVIVHLWARPRPFLFHPAILVMPGSTDPSFPSDHAAFAFALAACLVVVNRRLGILALLLAALIGFSRVFTGEHYPSDVLAGALIGAGVALTLSSQTARLSFLLEPLLRLARRAHLA